MLIDSAAQQLAATMRHQKAVLLLCCLCAAVGGIKADNDQEADEDVFVLTTDTFTNQIERSESPALVSTAEFLYDYAVGCSTTAAVDRVPPCSCCTTRSNS